MLQMIRIIKANSRSPLFLVMDLPSARLAVISLSSCRSSLSTRSYKQTAEIKHVDIIALLVCHQFRRQSDRFTLRATCLHRIDPHFSFLFIFCSFFFLTNVYKKPTSELHAVVNLYRLFSLIHLFFPQSCFLTSSNSANLLASSTPADKTAKSASQQEFFHYSSFTIFMFISHLEDRPFQQELSSCRVTVLESCSGHLCLLLD